MGESIMRRARARIALISALIWMTAGIVRGEDFTLKFFNDGPITLHTVLSSDDSSVHLRATATNDSGLAAKRVKICVTSPAMKDGCLFEIWNTTPWPPGTKMDWNLTSARKVTSLSHGAVIEEYEGDSSAAATSSQGAPGLRVRPEVDAKAPSPGDGALTNETLIKLHKAGLGDDVVLNMMSSQPGHYRKAPDDIIALKEGGLSDRIITALLNSSTDIPTETAGSSANAPSLSKVEIDSRLYIAPMTSNLDEFIGAEIVKQHVPMRVVLNEQDADYILSGLSQKTEVKWYDVVSGSVVGGKDRLEASAKLVRVRDKTFVWAGESGDRSLIFGALKRGGQRKLAERIVGQLKRDLF